MIRDLREIKVNDSKNDDENEENVEVSQNSGNKSHSGVLSSFTEFRILRLNKIIKNCSKKICRNTKYFFREIYMFK